MESFLSDITSVDKLILTILAFLFITVIGLAGKIVYDMWNDHRRDCKLHDKLDMIHKDNNAIKHYIKDKGIDDFTWDCNYWSKKGYITPSAKAGLIRRYNDLKDLGANGEREVGKEIIDILKIKDE